MPARTHCALLEGKVPPWARWLQFAPQHEAASDAGMATFVSMAKRVSARSQRRAVQESLCEFRDFVDDKAPLGKLRRSLVPTPHSAGELKVGGVVLCHPKDILDAKAKHRHHLWGQTALDEDA
eukprot:2488168-Pyramimonas_sp.AAC.1